MIFLMVMFPFVYRAWRYEQPSRETVVPQTAAVPPVKSLPEIGVAFQTAVSAMMARAASLEAPQRSVFIEPDSSKEPSAFPRPSLWLQPIFGLEGSEARPEKILVGVDGSEASKAAEKDAAFLAGHYRCVTFPMTTTEKPVAPALLAAAYKNRCDMIAVGTPVRSLKERVYGGSTAESLIKSSALPVWISRPGPRGTLPGRLKRILVAIDETRHSLRTIAQSLLLAHDFDASFTILHVREKNQSRQSAFDQNLPLLDRIPWALKTVEEEPARPSAAQTIAAYAHHHECDLIVMGAHREDLRSTALSPSHAAEVLRAASEEEARPMLVLHPYV